MVRGGTGSGTQSGARTNLGLGTAAVVNTGTTGGTAALLGSGGEFEVAQIPNLPNTKITGLGTLSTVDHTVLTRAQYDALTPVAGRFYFVPLMT